MTWRYYAADQSAGAVAVVFAAQNFDDERSPGPVRGTWHGKEYRGEFELVDGVRTYRIVGRDGWWTVEPKEEGR